MFIVRNTPWTNLWQTTLTLSRLQGNDLVDIGSRRGCYLTYLSYSINYDSRAKWERGHSFLTGTPTRNQLGQDGYRIDHKTITFGGVREMGLKSLFLFFLALKGTVSRDEIKHRGCQELMIHETVFFLLSKQSCKEYQIKVGRVTTGNENYKNRAARERKEKHTRMSLLIFVKTPHPRV